MESTTIHIDQELEGHIRYAERHAGAISSAIALRRLVGLLDAAGTADPYTDPPDTTDTDGSDLTAHFGRASAYCPECGHRTPGHYGTCARNAYAHDGATATGAHPDDGPTIAADPHFNRE
jgi:hypothetical protein